MPQSKSQERTKETFAFVNVDRPDQSLTKKSRKLIHQHVGKYYRNRSKPAQRARHEIHFVKVSTAFASTDTCANNHHSSSNFETNIEQSLPPHRDVVLLQHERPDLDVLSAMLQPHDENIVSGRRFRGDGLTGEVDEDSDRELEALRNNWKHSIVNHLGQGRKDPFAHYPVDDPHDQVSILVDHGMALDLKMNLANDSRQLYSISGRA